MEGEGDDRGERSCTRAREGGRERGRERLRENVRKYMGRQDSLMCALTLIATTKVVAQVSCALIQLLFSSILYYERTRLHECAVEDDPQAPGVNARADNDPV